MVENEFSTGSSVSTTVISIVYYSLLSRARIMRGLLLKRYAILLKRYAEITQKVRCLLLKRYAENFRSPQGGCGKLIGFAQQKFY